MSSEASPTSLAIIADVHGNTWALDVVLQDIARRGLSTIVNLGDSVFGSLDPGGAAERLMNQARSISGNQDRVVHTPTDEVRQADHAFVVSHLQPAHIDWLRHLPDTLTIGDVFCCHGTPTSDDTYMLENVTAHGVFLKSSAEIAHLLADVHHPVIVCGHSHVPHTVWLPDGRLIVNPGSVGVPAYEHDVPYPHAMEAGSPHARYAVLTQHPAGWSVEHIALAYAWGTAAEAARRNGRADRAFWIEYGRARNHTRPST